MASTLTEHCTVSSRQATTSGLSQRHHWLGRRRISLLRYGMMITSRACPTTAQRPSKGRTAASSTSTPTARMRCAPAAHPWPDSIWLQSFCPSCLLREVKVILCTDEGSRRTIAEHPVLLSKQTNTFQT